MAGRPISRTWKKAIVWHSKLYRFSLIHWIFSLGVLCIELQPVRDGWAATPLYKGKREFFTLSLYHFITKFVLTTIIEHVTSVHAKMVTTLKICFANKERSLEGSLGNVGTKDEKRKTKEKSHSHRHCHSQKTLCVSVPLCTIIVIVINFKQPEGRLNH